MKAISGLHMPMLQAEEQHSEETSFAFGNFTGLKCCLQLRAVVVSFSDLYMGRMNYSSVDLSVGQFDEKMNSQKLQWSCLMD